MAQVFIPKFDKLTSGTQKSFERELRLGGVLNRKLQRERGNTFSRLKRTAERHKNYQRKPGCELELMSVVDARTWFRWQQEDPHFWSDKKNIEKFTKDNPIAAPWKHA
mgnify:FL=1